MKTGYQNKSLQLNTELRGHASGSVLRIKVDSKDVPKDPYWRNRLKDAEHDNCCKLVSKKRAGAKKVAAIVED